MPLEGSHFVMDTLRTFESQGQVCFYFTRKSGGKTVPTCPMELDIMYWDAVRNYMLGKYPMDEATATKLAALMLQAKEGDGDVASHVICV